MILADHFGANGLDVGAGYYSIASSVLTALKLVAG